MLLEINFTIVLFAISFLVFIYLLNLTLYKPVGEIIEKRKSTIEREYATSKELTQNAKELLESYKSDIKTARHDAQIIIQGTITEAQKIKEKKISILTANLIKEKEITLKQIQVEQKIAMKELEGKIKILTDLITNRVLGMEGSLVGTH